MSEAIPSREDLSAAEGGPAPVVLPSNQLRRFYRGGARIARLRGQEATDAGGPEDWVGSAATSWGSPTEGLSRLPDGRYLRDAIQADPAGFLGVEHVRRWGSEPGLLVKLLDAGERLGVHFHPGPSVRPRGAASELRQDRGLDHRRSRRGRRRIPRAQGAGAARRRSRDGPMSRTSPRCSTRCTRSRSSRVTRCSSRPGTLHAIGEGILLVELQEPTDLSVLLEWQRFGVDDGSETLGLGWDRVLAVSRSPAAMPELGSADRADDARHGIAELLPAAADPYFRAQRIVVEGDPVALEPSFRDPVVLEGSADRVERPRRHARVAQRRERAGSVRRRHDDARRACDDDPLPDRRPRRGAWPMVTGRV